jgi:hypothetical protein
VKKKTGIDIWAKEAADRALQCWSEYRSPVRGLGVSQVYSVLSSSFWDKTESHLDEKDW